MEDLLIELIEKNGPMTGSEIKEATGEDSLLIWKTCKVSDRIIIERLGERYLRLDKRIKGFARLSPSILREFLTYSVVGLASRQQDIKKRAEDIRLHIEKVSRGKFDLALRFASDIMERSENRWTDSYPVCFIIAGDIVYNMAHDCPRPEQSTGKMVNGSDIDLIIVATDEASDDFLKQLDESIYSEKYRMLTNPSLREEIDYVVKKISRVKEQVNFDTFRHMIACKILDEGVFLHGNRELFFSVKNLLRESGVSEKIKKLEVDAQVFRGNAERYLLETKTDRIKKDSLYLFYPSEESEEFE